MLNVIFRLTTWKNHFKEDALMTSSDQNVVKSTRFIDSELDTCSPQNQIAFIKTHKTASTTLQTIVNRYGFFQNLSFVFNKNSINNGHFYFIPLTPRNQQRLFLPPLKVRFTDYPRYNFDIIAVHVRYDRVTMEKFMKKNTKYISIIRDPVTQWESAFDFFKFQDAFGPNMTQIPEDMWIETFLNNPSFYREKLKHLWYENVVGRRWYYARNSQIFDFGLDSSKFDDEVVINNTIKHLEQEFTFILLAEYFDESLLILKKEFCWKYEDIVYLRKNTRVKRRKLSTDVQQRIRDWNRADWLLYQYFNKTFWNKVINYGPHFDQDLVYFRNFNLEIFQKCASKNVARIYKNIEFIPKTNSSLFCRTIAGDKQSLFRRIFNRQNPMKIYHVYK